MRFGLAGLLLGAAGVWRLAGPKGQVVARLGPFPDLMSADVLTVPLTVAALAVLAGASQVPRSRKVVGVAALVTAVLWVTSEWPWDDPLIPGLQWGRHGVHVLDAVAVAPALLGLAALSPWSPRRTRRLPGHLA